MGQGGRGAGRGGAGAGALGAGPHMVPMISPWTILSGMSARMMRRASRAGKGSRSSCRRESAIASSGPTRSGREESA